MKKTFILLTFITIVFVSNDLLSSKDIIIPKEAIRFRVIANSNSKEDQELKIAVKTNLEKDLNNIINKNNNLKSVRLKLQENIPTFEENVQDTLKKYNKDLPYNISYGENYFPSKNYKGVTYQSGDYESLVVKLGSAKGNNFWCVLFPPLCLIDENQKSNKDIEYHLLVKDLINQYL